MIKKIKIAMLCITCIASKYSQAQIDSTEIESMDEIIISTKKVPSKRGDIARQVEVLSGKQIAEMQAATLADAIQLSGKAYIQKSQLGGGSISMRGFEASRLLLVIDGVRVNNATFRAGHLQDIITFDQFALQNTEFLFGGGSSMYGSDALGGVVYMQTKKLNFYDSLSIKPYANLRFATAGNNATANAGIEVATSKVSVLANVTANSFGDLRMGTGSFGGIDSFGYRSYYLRYTNGKDSIYKNNDARIQVGSGYNQMDYMLKAKFKSKTFNHGFNLNTSRSSVIPRYDRLNLVRNGKLVHAVWNYTPQNRSMGLYFIEKNTTKFGYKTTAAVQQTTIGRQTRRNGDTITELTLDKVYMYTLNADYYRNWSSKFSSFIGAEAVYNNVKSKGTATNILTGKEQAAIARYTDSTTYTTAYSMYAGFKGSAMRNKLHYDGALRITHYTLVANYASKFAANFPLKAFNFNNTAPSLDLGMVYQFTKDFSVTASAQSAFRNPNVDDISKLFETTAGIKLVVPNNKLLEERTATAEMGLRYATNKLNLEAGAYSTAARNLMVDNARGDSLIYQGIKTPVFHTVNAAMGRIQGLYFNFQAQVINSVFVFGNISLTQGVYKLNAAAAEQPLDHIPPTFGRWGIKYKKQDFQMQFYSVFNGMKARSEYSPSGEDNQNYAPNGYSPAWRTYHVAIRYQVNKEFATYLNMDNLANKNYRTFASGINAGGRNLSLTLQYQF